ncbi:MAG: hypothetical protein JXA93_13160 [Anaerolineae bacterium]|nr:hypothetical protein [Anaerolineae bacterium]
MEKQIVVQQPAVEPAALPAGQAVPVAGVRARAARLFFVDNIRVFLTILVILHHLMITYAGTGDWPYNEHREDAVTSALGGWFCATNQSYFNAYTAYIIHTPLIVYLASGLRSIALYPLLKFALVAPVAVLLCFGLSSLIRKIPYADRVL